MHNKNNMIITVCVILGVFMVVSGIAFAEIYRYKDENGHWRFTDTPLDIPQNAQKMKHVIENKEDFVFEEEGSGQPPQPKNAIERAVLGTVGIQTVAGSGTGFFIARNGYIITNKHVLRGDVKRNHYIEKAMDNYGEKLKELEKHLKQDEARAAKVRAHLEKLKRHMRLQSTSPLKKENQRRIADDMEVLVNYEQRIQAKRKQIKDARKKLHKQANKIQSNEAMAGLSRTFKIRFSDNSEKIAYLVKESQDHDLALLKIDHYQSSFLSPSDPHQMAQGQTVYAIGNPITLKNSVAAGVFSGFENNFIKTDAKIYPGNSGGPLVNEAGQVVGINSFKKLTRAFEGLGFAIPIDVALKEFKPVMKE